jgi:hypothetical protein
VSDKPNGGRTPDDLMYRINCLIHDLDMALKSARLIRDELVEQRKERKRGERHAVQKGNRLSTD